MKKSYNRSFFTRLPGKYALVHPAVEWIEGNSSDSHANNIYSPSSDKLTEVELYMSTSCQPGSRVIRGFSDIEKPSLFSDLVVKAAKSEKKAFQGQRRLRLAAG